MPESQLAPPTKKDLTPHGIPKVVIWMSYNIVLSLGVTFVTNTTAFVNLALDAGACSWESDMTRDQIYEMLSATGSLGLSLSYVTMALYGLFSTKIPLTAAAVCAISSLAIAIYTVFFTSSTMLVKLGILSGQQTIIFILIYCFQIGAIFPDHFNVVSAICSLCGDISFAITTFISIGSAKSGYSIQSLVSVVLGLWLVVGSFSIYATPASWTPYVNAMKAQKGLITLEEWHAGKQTGMQSKKQEVSYNPETEPLYHSYTSIRKVFTTKHAILFTSWFLLHCIRGKKLVHPFLKLVMNEKGGESDLDQETIDAMFQLWGIMPGVLGFAPNLVFAVAADKFGQIPTWWVANAICSTLFIIIRYMPWTWMYIGGVVLVIENALMFCLIPMFFGKQYGAHNITKAMSIVYSMMAVIGFSIDFFQKKIIDTFYNGSYLASVSASVWLSVIAFIPITMLLFLPMPGPPGKNFDGHKAVLEPLDDVSEDSE